jgi:pullulanase/glycogen debranching enzyme
VPKAAADDARCCTQRRGPVAPRPAGYACSVPRARHSCSPATRSATASSGNNNVYCQDNPITWLDWAGADHGLCAFVAALAALRRRHPGLRHPVWFRGEPLAGSTLPDIVWLQADGRALQASDWTHCPQGSLGALIAVGEHDRAPTERLLLIWHNGQAPVRFGLPPGPWSLWLDSARAFVAADTYTAEAMHGDLMDLQDTRVCLLVQTLHADGQPPNTPT